MRGAPHIALRHAIMRWLGYSPPPWSRGKPLQAKHRSSLVSLFCKLAPTTVLYARAAPFATRARSANPPSAVKRCARS